MGLELNRLSRLIKASLFNRLVSAEKEKKLASFFYCCER